MNKLLYIVLILALAGSVVASPSKLGSAGAQFLKIGVGSRYQAMGEAATATATDVYSMYWNPAGLVEVDNWSVGFTNVNWFMDVDLNYVGVAKNFEDFGVIGASVTVLSAGEQEITTVDQQDGTGQSYSASSYAIGLTYAKQLTSRFAFGGSFKFIGEDIGLVSAKGFAFDFGTMLYTGFESLRMGMSISNMGPDMSFSGAGLDVAYDSQGGNDANTPVDASLQTTPYHLPLTFRVGAAYDFDFGADALVTLSGDFKHPNDHDQQASLGAQIAFKERFFLRGGRMFNYDEQTFSLGGGLETNLSDDSKLVIDYAWQDFGRLQSTQRFSIGFIF